MSKYFSYGVGDGTLFGLCNYKVILKFRSGFYEFEPDIFRYGDGLWLFADGDGCCENCYNLVIGQSYE